MTDSILLDRLRERSGGWTNAGTTKWGQQVGQGTVGFQQNGNRVENGLLIGLDH